MRDDGVSAAATSSARRTRLVTLAVFSTLLVVALIVVDVAVLGLNLPAKALSPHYYMALGDSLSFGYQPNFDFSAGFADDVFNDLHQVNVSEVVNYACAGETTETMINGGCAAQFAHHGSYTGAQLQAAIDFLSNSRHQGRVSPITLEIGVNDVVNDYNPETCTASPSADADLATMDANITSVILPRLLKVLGTATSAHVGDLHMLNYYNPYAKVCANSATFVHLLNNHLQADAAKYRVPVIDVYNAFGGDMGMAANICTYTWYCDPRFHDFHPTNAGYRKIADTVESSLGLPGTNPLMPAAPAAPAAVVGVVEFISRYVTLRRGTASDAASQRLSWRASACD